MSKNHMCRKVSILLLVLLLIFPSLTYGVRTEAIQFYEDEPDLYFLLEVFQYIKDDYPYEVEDKTLIEGALKGMLQGLDPYSDYYTEEEAAEIYNILFNTFGGIGIYIEKIGDYINIVDTIENSPAYNKGLKKGDTIVSIDGLDIKGLSLDEVSKLLRGIKGTGVRLEIRREGKKSLLQFEIIRDIITIKTVKYEILEDNIGHISISEFTESTTSELLEALVEMDEKNINKLILDLRDNPGGLLNQALWVSRLFIPEGPIVHIKERNKPLQTYQSYSSDKKYDIVLLVNENSASASEIVAAAIKDTKSGIIIGKNTFGKGIVQSMIPLGNGGILKMTTAEYLTPNKTSIHGVGVTPDIEVENVNDVDEQLNRAIIELRKHN